MERGTLRPDKVWSGLVSTGEAWNVARPGMVWQDLVGFGLARNAVGCGQAGQGQTGSGGAGYGKEQGPVRFCSAERGGSAAGFDMAGNVASSGKVRANPGEA